MVSCGVKTGPDFLSLFKREERIGLTALWTYNSHTIQLHTYSAELQSFWCTHGITSIWEYFPDPQKKLCVLWLSLFPASSDLRNHAPTFYIDFPVLDSPCIWNHIIGSLRTGFFHLVCFLGSSMLNMYQYFISLYHQMIFHCVDVLHQFMGIWDVSTFW